MSEKYRSASEKSEVEDTRTIQYPMGHEGGFSLRSLLLSSIFKGDAISGSLDAILDAIQDHCSKHRYTDSHQASGKSHWMHSDRGISAPQLLTSPSRFTP